MADRMIWLRPDWAAPPSVRAGVTTRAGGRSRAPYASFNLADHVGDDPGAVAANRARLRAGLRLPAEPVWLEQAHGATAIDAGEPGGSTAADASYCSRPGVVCAVLSADCLPVMLCTRAGDRVALAHAGWRGLAAGVIEAAIDALESTPRDLLAWLGPAIGPTAYEVGTDVRGALMASDPGAGSAFRPSGNGRWTADLYHLAKRRLARSGVFGAAGGGRCTYREADHFYSYRRDGATGRMASLIWIDEG